MLTLNRIKNKVKREIKSKISPIKAVKIKENKEIKTKKDLNIKNKSDAKIINELVRNFMDTFGANEINNKDMIGYTLSHIEAHDYGVSARIYAPYGMILGALETHTPLIETGCKCQFLYEIPEHRQFALATFIHPEKIKINDWVFSPVEVKPWQFFPGYSIKGEPIIFDLNKMPQVLDAGQQRRGKNGAVDHAIVSWINSCDEKEITFYMLQCARNDLIKYRDCKQVYCYADTFEKILIALDHVKKEMDRRVKLFEVMVGKGESKDNIMHYNLSHPSNSIPYIIVVMDEFIELIVDPVVDDKDMKKLKAKILKRVQQIGQFGGSLGVNYIILHQKPSAALMPVFIKNQSSIRLCFGFDDLTCCAIVLGDELAKHSHKLPPRKAFYGSSDGNGFMYTSNLTNRIRKFIEPSIEPNHRNLFTDLAKLEAKPVIDIPNISKNDSNKKKKSKGKAPLPKATQSPQITQTPIVPQPQISQTSEITFTRLDKPLDNPVKIITVKPISKIKKEDVHKDTKVIPKIIIEELEEIQSIKNNTPQSPIEVEYEEVESNKVIVKEELVTIKNENKAIANIESKTITQPIIKEIKIKQSRTNFHPSKEFSNVDSTVIIPKEQELANGIAKIDNYVPYKPIIPKLRKKL